MLNGTPFGFNSKGIPLDQTSVKISSNIKQKVIPNPEIKNIVKNLSPSYKKKRSSNKL
jgi:hypothetical protein